MLYLLDLYYGFNYAASLIHAIGSLFLCLFINVLYASGFDGIGLLFAKLSIWHSLIYFIADSFQFRSEKDNSINWSKIVHHAVCIFSGFTCLQFNDNAFLFSINGLALHEASNPFWSILRMHIDGKKFSNSGFPPIWDNNKWFDKTHVGVMFVVIFGICRFIIWPYYFYFYFPKDDIPVTAVYYCVYPLFVISIYWFILMLQGMQKNLSNMKMIDGSSNNNKISVHLPRSGSESSSASKDNGESTYGNNGNNRYNRDSRGLKQIFPVNNREELIKRRNAFKLQIEVINKQLAHKHNNKMDNHDLLERKKILQNLIKEINVQLKN